MNGTPSPSDTGTYVYCVAPAQPFVGGSVHFSSPAIGRQGGEVRWIQHNDLVAVVSTSPRIRYTLRREYLEAHERVVEETMAHTDVLPVSFGSVAESDERVRSRLLSRRFDELHQYLEYVRGRVELGVRAHWNRERVFEEVVAENPEIRGLRENIAGRSPEATYYERIQLGEMTEATIVAKREAEADALLSALSPLAEETKVNKELTDMMVLNAAFLVDKTREQLFDAQVQSISETETGRLILQYVGPVPPYNFVNLRVHWQE